jgi:hypothetical protein
MPTPDVIDALRESVGSGSEDDRKARLRAVYTSLMCCPQELVASEIAILISRLRAYVAGAQYIHFQRSGVRGHPTCPHPKRKLNTN